MAKLEDLTRGAAVKGILPDCLVTVIDVKWYGSAAIELTYKDPPESPTSCCFTGIANPPWKSAKPVDRGALKRWATTTASWSRGRPWRRKRLNCANLGEMD